MIIPLSAFTAGILLSPLISLIAGILILIMPRLLNFIVAIYLIVIGVVGVFHLCKRKEPAEISTVVRSLKESK